MSLLNNHAERVHRFFSFFCAQCLPLDFFHRPCSHVSPADVVYYHVTSCLIPPCNLLIYLLHELFSALFRCAHKLMCFGPCRHPFLSFAVPTHTLVSSLIMNPDAAVVLKHPSMELNHCRRPLRRLIPRRSSPHFQAVCIVYGKCAPK